jgi:hypothetical protein
MSNSRFHGYSRRGYQPNYMGGAHPSTSYNPTRIVDPRGSVPKSQPTRTTTNNQPHRTTQPHLTEYNRSGSIQSVCRCANPTSYGDAFTRRDWIYCRRGRPTLSVTGEALGWEVSSGPFTLHHCTTRSQKNCAFMESKRKRHHSISIYPPPLFRITSMPP